MAAIDARGGRVYAQAIAPNGRTIIPPSILSVREIVRALGSSGVLLVGWRIADDELTLRVTDGGSMKRIQPRESSPMSDSGRGLHIVERLVSAWGVTDHAGSLRTVWAVLPVHERPITLRLVRS